MKKIAFSLIALAALATASFAGSNSGEYSEQVKDSAPAVNAFAVANDGQALTNFERVTKRSQENTVNRH